jgi:HlyD family secretion protein
MKKRLVVFLLLPFIALSCGPGGKREETPKEVTQAKMRTVRMEILATGAVKPKVGAEVKVGSRISGKLEQLMVQAGDPVKVGQLIAVVEHKDLQAQVDKLVAVLKGLKVRKVEDLAETLHAIRELKAKLDLARLELKRYSTLYKRDYVPKDDVDKAQRDVKVLEAQLEATRRQYQSIRAKYDQDIGQTKAELAEVQVKLSYALIHAPISGTVSSVSTQQGETVVAGLNAPTFITVIDLARLQVDAYVDETDIGQVKPGEAVEFTVDAFPDRVFKGEVFTVYPGAVIRDNVVFYDVAIDIKDTYLGLLRPEMTANVTIIAGERKEVLTVPSKALRMDEKGGSYVMVKEGRGWKKRYVEVGWSSKGYTQILKGVNEGEETGVW